MEFSDGTRSEDSHVADIYACTCNTLTGHQCVGRHAIGAQVRLRWQAPNGGVEENEGRLNNIYQKTYYQVGSFASFPLQNEAS